jgi:DNA adenine methylase
MTTHYSPLRYPGGKTCIFPFVSSLFYKNDLLGCNYAEPYAGGAGLALRLLVEGYVDKIYINDLDRSIYAFWFSIIYRCDDFCRWIENVEISMKNWYLYKEMQSEKDSLDIFDLGISTFFLNRTNVSGIIKGGVIGGKEQKGKYKIDARFNKKDLIDKIKLISSLHRRIVLCNEDAFDFIESINKRKEHFFIYIDPPYLHKGADLYMNYYFEKDHLKLSKIIKKVKKHWLLTYDKQEYIYDLYKKYNILQHSLSQSTSNRSGDELIIFPNKINVSISIPQLKKVQVLNDLRSEYSDLAGTATSSRSG